MVRIAPDDLDSGSSVWDFVDRDKPPLQRIDFLGLIGAFGKAGVLAIVSALIAIPLALAGAFSEVLEAAGFNITGPLTALTDGFTVLQQAAIAETSGAVQDLGFAALPAATAAALAPIAVLAFVIALAWGFD